MICLVTSCSQFSAACTAASADAKVGVGAGIAGICSSPFVSSRYLHELHRVLLLFVGLLEEQLGEQRQLALTEMRRDADGTACWRRIRGRSVR